MEDITATTVPIKLALSGTKRRTRLDVPLRFSKLYLQVRSTFPDIKDFNLQYVDEEGDRIDVTCDEDLKEAQSVFKDFGRVLSFIVDTTTTAGKTKDEPARPPPPASPAASKFCSSKSCFGQTARTIGNYDFLIEAMGSLCGVACGARNKPAAFPKQGTVVELHSLTTTALNGRRGHCGGFDRERGRHRVDLFATATAAAKTVAVRTCNVKSATLGTTSSSEEHERLLLSNTPLCPGSSGPDVAMLQKVLIQLGHMHPSAIRWRQGFYGPRTAEAVAKVSKAIGCTSGYIFTDRVRAKLLKELASPRPALHYGITCDGSSQNPLVGPRYHKIGQNFDLNETEFSKLVPNEQEKYEIIFSPGATPVPVLRATPVPVSNTPDCVFVRDITIPDGQVVSAGEQFKKTWLVKTGATGWPAACALIHIGGDKMGATSRIELAPQKPNAHVEVSVDFTAPSLGKVTSKWRVIGPDGKLFGHQMWATIIVQPLTASVSTASTVVAEISPALPAPDTASETPREHPVMVLSKTPATVSVPVEAVSDTPRTVAASVTPPTVSAPVASENPREPPVPASPSISPLVQQLLGMGFALPVETLVSVLNSVHGDVRAAVTALVGAE